MSADGNNESGPFSLFSLVQLTHLALTPEQLIECKINMKDLDSKLEYCCKMLHKIIKMNSANGRFNPFNHRGDMFGKVVRRDLNRQQIRRKLTTTAVRLGHYKCLKMADEIGFPLVRIIGEAPLDKKTCSYNGCSILWTMNLCNEAAFHGHLSCLQYTHQYGFLMTQSVCTAAIVGQNLDCLKYAVENGATLNSGTIIPAAIVGNLPILKYLHQRGCPWTVSVCVYAIQNKNFDCLKYAVENNCPLNNSSPANEAVVNGDITILRYLHEHGCPLDMMTCTKAITAGHYDCLKFAVENISRSEYTSGPMHTAASQGKIEILKYLHEQGFPWSKRTCSLAATKGHLECLKYARANGCPWDSRTFIGPLSSLLMISSYPCADFKEIRKCSREFIKSLPGNQIAECLSYAWRNGCPWSSGTCRTGPGDGRMDCLLSKPDHDCKWGRKRFCRYGTFLRQKKSINTTQIACLLIRCVKKYEL